MHNNKIHERALLFITSTTLSSWHIVTLHWEVQRSHHCCAPYGWVTFASFHGSQLKWWQPIHPCQWQLQKDISISIDKGSDPLLYTSTRYQISRFWVQQLQ